MLIVANQPCMSIPEQPQSVVHDLNVPDSQSTLPGHIWLQPYLWS